VPRLEDVLATEAELVAKYGDDLFDHPPAITRERLVEKLAVRDALDQHFAHESLAEYASIGMRRRVLDERTLFLVQVAQFTVTRSHRHLRDALRAALAGPVPLRDALEAILQCHVYAGETVLDPALEILVAVIDDLGGHPDLGTGQLPLTGRDGERDLDAERGTWPDDVRADPRRERFMAAHGWLGISAGIHAKGVQHLNILEYRDAISPEWTSLWLRFVYQHLYSRRIFDDRTRLLGAAAACIALGEAVQTREHMTGAMAAGATVQELLELVQMSAIYFGYPRMGGALRILVGIMADQGRLDEIGNPPVDPQVNPPAARRSSPG